MISLSSSAKDLCASTEGRCCVAVINQYQIHHRVITTTTSNKLEFTSLEDGGKNEKTPLLDQITSRQRKSPDSPAPVVRYPDINSNESGKATGKFGFVFRDSGVFPSSLCIHSLYSLKM